MIRAVTVSCKILRVFNNYDGPFQQAKNNLTYNFLSLTDDPFQGYV